MVHEETYKGLRLEVYQDEQPESPREWDNFGKMVCWHNGYELGDKHDWEIEDFRDFIKTERPIILSLYLYDHSGIGMSTSNVAYPYNCPWDAGQVGFIYITEKDVLRELKRKKMTKVLHEHALDMLQNEVDVYHQYLQGDVYYFSVVRPKNCKECKSNIDERLDSCGGFYGVDSAIKEGKEAIDLEVEK